MATLKGGGSATAGPQRFESTVGMRRSGSGFGLSVFPRWLVLRFVDYIVGFYDVIRARDELEIKCYHAESLPHVVISLGVAFIASFGATIMTVIFLRLASLGTGPRLFSHLIRHPSAPLYSKLGSREGFAHWTTSHLPPRKKLEGKKNAFAFTLLPFGQFPEVNEPLPPGAWPKDRDPTSKKENKSSVIKRDGGGGGVNPAAVVGNILKRVAGSSSNINGNPGSGNGNGNGNGRRGLGHRLRQRIGRLFRPLEVLRLVTVLFLNVTYSVTMETFSLPRHALIVAKWLWPDALDKMLWWDALDKMMKGGDGKRRGRGEDDGGGGGKPVRGGVQDADGGGGDSLGRGGKGGSGGGGIHLKARMQDSLKDLGKNSKKWSAALSRSVSGTVSGMRRGLGSNEKLNEQLRIDYLVKEGRRCNSICDSSGAVESFRAAVAMRPTDPELLVCLSKSLSDRVFEKDIFDNRPLARAICKEAADLSKKAIDISPNYAEARVSLGAALGRLAMWSDNREKVELSRSIKDECEEAIRLDVENDLAMHVLGRYEHQMAGLGRIVRTLVRVMYGGTLAPGTLQGAEELFRRAIAIRPNRLIHRVELGKLLIDRGRKEQAKAEFEVAVTLPREDINSECERRDAMGLLKKHWGVIVETPTFEDPPPTPQPRLSRRSFDRRTSLDGVDELPPASGGGVARVTVKK